jgi:hypothetical protein
MRILMRMHEWHFLEHASADECGKCRAGEQVRSARSGATGRKAALLEVDFFPPLQALEGSS